MKQGCILVNPELIAMPEIFDALLDSFELIRQLEVNESTHILVVQHEQFMEAAPGEILPFYDIDLERAGDLIQVKEISAPYIHSKYFIQCQTKTEPARTQEPESPESLIWTPEM